MIDNHTTVANNKNDKLPIYLFKIKYITNNIIDEENDGYKDNNLFHHKNGLRQTQFGL